MGAIFQLPEFLLQTLYILPLSQNGLRAQLLTEMTRAFGCLIRRMHLYPIFSQRKPSLLSVSIELLMLVNADYRLLTRFNSPGPTAVDVRRFAERRLRAFGGEFVSDMFDHYPVTVERPGSPRCAWMLKINQTKKKAGIYFILSNNRCPGRGNSSSLGPTRIKFSPVF